MQTDLWSARTAADDEYLSLQCDIVVVGYHNTALNMLIADLLGVSPRDELGYSRKFGYVDQEDGPGAMPAISATAA
jgi:hypothetical protein